MRVSLQWLNDYIDINIPPERLAEALTMVGLEVESVEYVRPRFSGVLVGRVKTLAAHPAADGLLVCSVETGKTDYQVVCGATNLFAGALVPLAVAGAFLGEKAVTEAVIKGIRSEGMLCSEVELGLGLDHTGIMILENNLTPGSFLDKTLPLEDVILEIGVTPNRADCLSLVGIAREVAAIVGGKLKYPAISIKEQGPDAASEAGVTIVDADLCPRYAARVIRQVKIGPSPFWLRQRLLACGLRPINNVVDVTNYVMMELGQPLHAFDLNRLAGRRIIVRRAQQGEPFLSLDGKEHILNDDTLMICDRDKPVAIAGIMGGENSEVTEITEDILLESAYFAPSSIRRSAKALAMISAASFRFERGIDPEGVTTALDRAAQLMALLAGGIICRGRIDAYPRPIISPVDIPLRIGKANQLLQTKLSGPEIVHLLGKIEFEVKPDPRNEGCFFVTPPSSRVDIKKEIDIIEEIIRIYGYDQVGATIPEISGQVLKDSPLDLIQKTIRRKLAGMGFTEVINFSFIPEKFNHLLNLSLADERSTAVKIANPLTEEQAVMRTSLIHGLLANWKDNANFGISDLKLFEIGRVFFPGAAGELPRERNMLAALVTGRRFQPGWDSSEVTVDFFDLKGWLEALLEQFQTGELFFSATDQEPFLHPGRTGYIMAGGKRLGFLGELNPATVAAWELKGRAVVGELDLDALALMGTRNITYKDISRFPATCRDAAFIIPREETADKLLKAIRETPQVLLEKVEVFDLYTGPGLAPQTKSLGLRFAYRSGERTLTDIEVNEIHQKLIDRIKEKTGATLRGAAN